MKSRPPTRFHFVDVLRGWAVLVMIETHVVNALLTDALKEETPFKILTFINGLVAPSFLFCAGFAFAISISRKWQEFVELTPSLGRYVLKLLFILVIAYSLHIPRFSLREMSALTDEQLWMIFYQSDILQVISLTLLGLVTLVVVLRKQTAMMGTATTIGLLIVFFAPIIRELDYSGWPIWLRPYMTMKYASQFPLFPWSAFLIGGATVGYGFIRADERKNTERTMRWLAAGAAAAIAVSLVVELLPFTVYSNHDFWRASPEFFFVRFGIISLLLVALWWKEQYRATSSRSVLALFGKESLLVYVAHLLIVYGYTFQFSFIRLWGHSLSYMESFGLAVGLTIAMYAMAFTWHWLKRADARIAKAAEVAVLGGTVLYFIVK